LAADPAYNNWLLATFGPNARNSLWITRQAVWQSSCLVEAQSIAAVAAKGECARVNTCGYCGWSRPKTEMPCVHLARGPLTLLSPPHRRTKPVVRDIEGHDSAVSVMPWSSRRWPTRQVEPEESDNIRQARDRALADAIRASGKPRKEAWGRHNDPVKGLPVGGLILEAQPDSAAVWVWMRQHGVAWDDTERKGAIPGGRRRDVDVGNAAGDDGLVDPAKLLHPRWRRHVDKPDAFLARWARQTAGRLDRVLVVGDEYIFNARRHRDVRLRKPHVLKATRRWPRFTPTMLSDEGRAKWELDNNLDHAMEVGRRRLDLGTFAHGDQLDNEGATAAGPAPSVPTEPTSSSAAGARWSGSRPTSTHASPGTTTRRQRPRRI
jgi:hypothetical protein